MRGVHGMGDARWDKYTETASGCWEWQGYIAKNGYARIYDPARPKGQQMQWAHRAFYEHLRGPIQVGYELDHTCCNTVCVNPAHLDEVTRVEHVRRTFARLGKDDKHARAAALRALGMTYAEIAGVLEYGGKGGAADAVRAAVAKGLVDPQAIPAASPLTEPEREDIRALYLAGIPQTEIGAWYGVDSSQISRICSGKTSHAERRAPLDREDAA